MQQGQAQGHLGTVVVLDEGVVELGLGVVRDPELIGFGFGVELDVACRKGLSRRMVIGMPIARV